MTDQYKVSSFHNGLRTSDICEKLGCDFREVKDVLNQLYLEGVIEIKNTINFKTVRLRHDDI
jgi:transcription initiation factor IIE alpha subunit